MKSVSLACFATGVFLLCGILGPATAGDDRKPAERGIRICKPYGPDTLECKEDSCFTDHDGQISICTVITWYEDNNTGGTWP